MITIHVCFKEKTEAFGKGWHKLPHHVYPFLSLCPLPCVFPYDMPLTRLIANTKYSLCSASDSHTSSRSVHSPSSLAFSFLSYHHINIVLFPLLKPTLATFLPLFHFFPLCRQSVSKSGQSSSSTTPFLILFKLILLRSFSLLLHQGQTIFVSVAMTTALRNPTVDLWWVLTDTFHSWYLILPWKSFFIWLLEYHIFQIFLSPYWQLLLSSW